MSLSSRSATPPLPSSLPSSEQDQKERASCGLSRPPFNRTMSAPVEPVQPPVKKKRRSRSKPSRKKEKEPPVSFVSNKAHFRWLDGSSSSGSSVESLDVFAEVFKKEVDVTVYFPWTGPPNSEDSDGPVKQLRSILS